MVCVAATLPFMASMEAAAESSVTKKFSIPVCLNMTSVLKRSSVSRFFLVQKGPLGVDTTPYTTVSMIGPPTVGAKKLLKKVSFSLRNLKLLFNTFREDLISYLTSQIIHHLRLDVTSKSLFSPLFFAFRIPLKKFRSIRRELTDSGRTAEELLADGHSLKYNFGFPSSNGPTPETLKNYLDVSTTLPPTELWSLHFH